MSAMEGKRRCFILAGLITGIIASIMVMLGFAATNSEKSEMVLTAPTEEVAAAEEPTTFYFDAATKNVEINGEVFPTTQETTLTEPEMAKFTAKAVVNGKEVLLTGEVPTTVLEPLIAEFKVVEGTQVTKFPNGFVTATIE